MADERIIEITQTDLDAMLDEAARRGALEALRTVGLADDSAATDLRDIRSLLSSWRDVRKSALQAIVKALTTAILGAILLGLGVKIGASKLISGG